MKLLSCETWNRSHAISCLKQLCRTLRCPDQVEEKITFLSLQSQVDSYVVFLLDLNQLHFVQRHNALKYIPQLLEFTFQPFSSISFHFEPSERHIPVLNRMIYGITPILETSLISELSKLVKKHFLTLQPAFKILS